MDLLAMSAWNLHRNMANSAQRLPIRIHPRDQREARSGAPENQPKPLGYANIPHPRCLPPWSRISHHSRASVDKLFGNALAKSTRFLSPSGGLRGAERRYVPRETDKAMRFPNRVEDGLVGAVAAYGQRSVSNPRSSNRVPISGPARHAQPLMPRCLHGLRRQQATLGLRQSRAAAARRPYAPTANTPIECPSGSVALSMPTNNGFIAAMPRPKLWLNSWPEPRMRVGNSSVRNGPIP
jgi:hypothetical protein